MYVNFTLDVFGLREVYLNVVMILLLCFFETVLHTVCTQCDMVIPYYIVDV